MNNNRVGSLRLLTDAALVAGLKSFLARERSDTASVVAHLAELDTRDVFLREGYSSLFVYCRDALGMSEGEAYNRIEVARASRRFPVVLDMLSDGRVHLTAVRLLAPHLTADNHADVLEAAHGKTKIEIQEIVARLAPRPDALASVRRVPASPPGLSPPVAAAPATASLVSPPQNAASVIAAPPAPGALAAATSATRMPALGASTVRRPVLHAAVTPLSPERYKLQVTISGETLEKMRLAKDTLSHAIPTSDDAVVLDRAFEALLEKLAKQKFAATEKPRVSRAMKTVTHVPTAAVQRAVWVRDLGRCRYIGPNGHRCDERRFVEFHHTDPRALGGEASVDLIELRCRPHNDYEGRLYFGSRRRPRVLVPEQVDLSHTLNILIGSTAPPGAISAGECDQHCWADQRRLSAAYRSRCAGRSRTPNAQAT
jgi:hypothetical protein